MEHGGWTFCAHNGACGIDSAAVVVARAKVGVIVTPLKLESSFENFRWYVYDGCGQIAQETYQVRC